MSNANSMSNDGKAMCSVQARRSAKRVLPPVPVPALAALPASADTYLVQGMQTSKELMRQQVWFDRYRDISTGAVAAEIQRIRSERSVRMSAQQSAQQSGPQGPPVCTQEITVWYFPGVFQKLPERLYRLRLFNVPGDVEVAGLPAGLRRLEVRGVSGCPTVRSLPGELRLLSLLRCRVELSAFPPHIEHIRLEQCLAAWVPAIPRTALAFIAISVALEEVPEGGAGLLELVLSGTSIRKVRRVPANLRVLFLSRCPLAQVPMLPNCLLAVSFEHTRIRRIENLPEGLLQANFAGCDLTSCGRVPSTVRALGLKNTFITNFSGCPPELRSLTLTVYQTTELSSLPPLLVRTEYNVNPHVRNPQAVHKFMQALPLRAQKLAESPMMAVAALMLYAAAQLAAPPRKRPRTLVQQGSSASSSASNAI